MHRIALYQGGQEYFQALAAAIAASYREVRLETYILHPDGAVRMVLEALVAAARRGVAVYLVADGVGTPPLPGTWVRALDEAGVRWHRFLPLRGLGVVVPGRWRRLHRKLCVVDGRWLFCGGINLIDDHLDLNHGPLDVARLDYAVCVSGPLVAQAQRLMERFWGRLDASYALEALRFRAAGSALVASALPGLPATWDVSAWAAGEALDGVRAQLALRDNVRNRSRIEHTYLRSIMGARSEVLIANAYFLPGGRLRQALVQAARRGVRVRLLVQGRYEYFMQYHAARPVFHELLRAGIEIWEYRAGFLHAKVAVVDSAWSTVGSSNLDPLSMLLAREANIVVEDARFARQLRDRLLEATRQGAHRLQAQQFAARPLRQRFFDWLAYGLMRLSIWVMGRRY
ncbi:MAG: cardiolipin synthase ClsB [Rhodoferax sp.]